jgi:hypothetical protein
MEEHQCKYISSRGILKSTVHHSLTPCSSTKMLINYNIKSIAKNNTIYICSSAMSHFINILLPKIKTPFKLVSGDCDETCPFDLLNKQEFELFISNKYLIHWYCQNNVIVHPKITTIPIGLDYHTISNNNNHSWGPKMYPLEQEKQLIELERKPFYNRKIKCYSNFHFFMTTRYGNNRKEAVRDISLDLVYYEPCKLPRLETWKNQVEYAFVISPHGNGLDCHRTWEALILGCIPIVTKSPLDILYKDLPVLIVNNWRDVTLELLHTTIEEFKLRRFNMDKLTLEYWLDIINK